MKRERALSDVLMPSSKGREIERSSDPLFAESLLRLRSAKKDMTDIRRNHMCDGPTCNPQNEADLKLEEPVTSNVFLCRLGSVHICSAFECPYYSETHDQVCPISKMQLGSGPKTSSYDSTDYRTWYAKTEATTTTTTTIVTKTLVKKAPPIHYHPIPHDILMDRASSMVKLLLFSKSRVWCNNVAYNAHKQDARDALQNHRKSRLSQRQLMYWTDRYRIQATHTSRPLPYTIYEFDEGLHNYYVSICTQVWKMALKYYLPSSEKRFDPSDGVTEIAPRLDFEQLCLGVMYAMRQGLPMRGVLLLPKDDFLLINMPLISHLSAFGIAKNQVNKGDRIIMRMYENAIASHVDPHSLTLDVSVMPQKEESVIIDVNGKRAKVTSSGHTLFMPTSRKK